MQEPRQSLDVNRRPADTHGASPASKKWGKKLRPVIYLLQTRLVAKPGDCSNSDDPAKIRWKTIGEISVAPLDPDCQRQRPARRFHIAEAHSDSGAATCLARLEIS